MHDRIAILGAGRLGEALVRGFLESGWRSPADLTLNNAGYQCVVSNITSYLKLVSEVYQISTK